MVSIVTENRFLWADLVGRTWSVLDDASYNDVSMFRSGLLLETDAGRLNGIDDRWMQQLYYFPAQGYYVVISDKVGTCDVCIKDIDTHLRNMINKAYVTHSKQDAEDYYREQVRLANYDD
mgnify:CR=1 FL=1